MAEKIYALGEKIKTWWSSNSINTPNFKINEHHKKPWKCKVLNLLFSFRKKQILITQQLTILVVSFTVI